VALTSRTQFSLAGFQMICSCQWSPNCLSLWLVLALFFRSGSRPFREIKKIAVLMSGRISYVVLSCEVAMDSELENRRKSTSWAQDSELWKSSRKSTVCYTVSQLLPEQSV
jgi:hypothetical protein